MKAISLCVVAALLATAVPGDGSDRVDGRNRDFFIQRFDAHMADQGGSPVDWSSDDASRFLDIVVARAGGVDLARAMEGGGGGGFPVATDFSLLETHAEVIWVHQRPNPGTACNQHGKGAAGGHYDGVVEGAPTAAHPAHGLTLTGVATSNWTRHGALGTAFVSAPGTYLAPPSGSGPVTSFDYEETVFYGGESDFWCLNYRLVLFGICIYLDVNFPRVLGAGAAVSPSVPAPAPRPPCP